MAVVVAFWTHLGTRRDDAVQREVAEDWDKPRLLAEPLVDLNIDSLPGTRVWDEVIREMDDKPRQWLDHLLHGKDISGEFRESVFEKAWRLVQRGLGGWDVLQSTGEAEASLALLDSTRHDDDDGGEENQGGGIGKGQGERGQRSHWTGAPPVEK